MLVFHSGDLHYSSETLDEVDRCFGFAVDHAIARKCDVAAITGDLFDHRVDLHSPAVAAICGRVRQLADHMPVILLAGTFSHDLPGSLDVFKTIGGAFPVHVADTIQQVALYFTGTRHYWISPPDDGVTGQVALFSCLPPVNKGAVAAVAGAHNAAAATGEYVYDLMRGWSVSHAEARTIGVPTLVLAHGTISGSITEHGCPMAGTDWELTTGTLFASEASAVLASHIHRHQSWEKDGRCIAYASSPGRLHHGEYDVKGFPIWTVTADGSTFEFIETPAKRLIDISFDGPPDMAKLREAAATADGAHVRIRWSVDEAHRDSIDKAAIEALFGNAEAIKTEGRIIPTQRQRAAGITQAHSLEAKLQQWCTTTGADAGPLIDRLSLIQQMEPEQAADLITGVQPVISNEKERAA